MDYSPFITLFRRYTLKFQEKGQKLLACVFILPVSDPPLLCSDIRLRVGLRVDERRQGRGVDRRKWLLKLLVMDRHSSVDRIMSMESRGVIRSTGSGM